MTALVIATDIPSSIVTVEQLAHWCGNVLNALNPDINSVEGDNFSQRAASSGTFYISSTNTHKHITRVSTDKDVLHLTGNLKPWMYAKEISTKPLTVAMKAN